MKGRLWISTMGLVAWLCFLNLGLIEGGRVLVVPVDGSHWLSMKILVKELNQKGHEVLVLVPDSSLLMNSKESFQTEVYKVPYPKSTLDNAMDSVKEGLFTEPKITDVFVNVQRLINFTSLQVIGCESLLVNQPLMSKLKERGFDALLTDPFLPCGPILSHILKIPAVYFLNGLPCGLDSSANMCPSPPSYVPSTFSGNTDVMNFPQRVKNMLMYFMDAYMCSILYKEFDDLVGRHIDNSMTYRDILSFGSIWLLRYDFVFLYPKPIMPNTVLIGGINCAKSAPLPADLQEFVDASGEDGFIVFTMGSMVSDMPKETAKQFFDAFRKIPQRVLWRFTGVQPEDVPKNLRLLKWLPQNDLLAHPNARAFITHGGTHGIYESLCNGVPMLMFPLFGDQGDNVHHMVSRGVAETLPIYDVTTEKLLTALNKILSDRSYKEKMVKLSKIHLDRPVEPTQLALHWTEYVMRHKGAVHLRVAAHDLNWFQYHSLDVVGFLLCILLTVLMVTLKCCLFCTRRCCRRGTVKPKQQ